MNPHGPAMMLKIPLPAGEGAGTSSLSTSSFSIFSEGFLPLPLEGRFLDLERSELGRGLADSFFYGDALHAGCTHKAVNGRPFEDLLHIRGRRDGAAVAQPKTSGLTDRAALAIFSVCSAASCRLIVSFAPIAPPTVNPIWAKIQSQPALAI